MKPKIGDIVYTIWHDQIYKEEVGYIGADSFLPTGFQYKDDSEYYYDDYGEVWFKTLEKAMKKVSKTFRNKYHCKVKIEQITEDTWECYDEEDD